MNFVGQTQAYLIRSREVMQQMLPNLRSSNPTLAHHIGCLITDADRLLEHWAGTTTDGLRQCRVTWTDGRGDNVREFQALAGQEYPVAAGVIATEWKANNIRSTLPRYRVEVLFGDTFWRKV